jgi:hypothetical protein
VYRYDLIGLKNRRFCLVENDRKGKNGLRRGPDGLEFWLQVTMLKVAPVSTKYLSLVNSSIKNIKPALAVKCIAVAVACVKKAAEPKGVQWRISFPTKNKAECTC